MKKERIEYLDVMKGFAIFIKTHSSRCIFIKIHRYNLSFWKLPKYALLFRPGCISF